MLKGLSRAIYKHPIITITSWIIVVVSIAVVALGGITGSNIFDRLDNSAPSVNGEAYKGDNLLEEADTGNKYTETIFIYIDGFKYYENNKKAKIDFIQFKDELKPYDIELITPYGLQQSIVRQSPDLEKLTTDTGFISIIEVVSKTDDELKDEVHKVLKITNNFATEIENDVNNSKVLVGSQTTAEEDVIASVEKDLIRGELISLPLALLVLIFVFGGFLAAGLPLIGAGVSIITSLGTLFVLSYAFNMHTSVLNVLTVIGLGLSIDYGLLMLSRFRESLREEAELKRTRNPVREALTKTLNTAGKTVIFSGLTVAIATATLILFEPDIMKSIGVATTTVVLLAVVTSITLLPALFVLFNNRLIKPSVLTSVPVIGRALKGFGDVPPKKGFFTKLVRKVQKHPWLWAISTTLILVLAGTSVANLQMSSLSSRVLPNNSQSKEIFDLIDKEFPNLQPADITLVFDTTDENLVNDYKNVLDKENYDFTKMKVKDGLFTITLNVDNDVKEHVLKIRELRDSNNDQDVVYVTGATAQDIDYIDSLLKTAPYVALIIMFMTGLLLFLMTGSALIPLKAIFLSVLSLSASIGVIVWGFQEGHLSEILNFDPTNIEQIDPIMIILILVLGFGLAMDYEMFLISRIKEKHAHGESNNYAVRAGIQASGRIITSAALMMVVVFLGFALGDNISIKMMGVALSAAIIIDATIVRCLLLPAIMTIVGEKIWWSPSWMKKIHAKIGVEH